MNASTLRKLSTLLDEALALSPEERHAWIDRVAGEDAQLRATLRAMLEPPDGPETFDIVERGPAFTLPASAPEDLEHQPGDAVGPYRLVRLIGRGGMGDVWLAERSDGLVRRPVALKLPMLGLRRAALVRRFARERDILAALTHAHIARLYDAGVAADGQPFLALEYVEGRPITDYCSEHAVALRGRIELLRQVADAVQYAHSNLVVHRDLKPSNLLVTSDGKAMLLDFGIAKLLQDAEGEAQETELTRYAGRALTPDYAAPEQLTGAPISTATDVYALGLVAYELLAGRRPFDAKSRADLEHAVVAVVPPRPSHVPGGVLAHASRSIASDLDAIVLKALKKAPGERYATVNALSADLDRWLTGERVLAQHDSVGYRARKFVGRHRIGVALSSLLVVMLASATAFSAWQASIARREARTAEAVETFMREVFAMNTGQQADPVAARGATARELLDRGAKRVDAVLADVPEARARVLETLADMYGELALYQQTLELRTKQVEILRTTESPSSVRLATAIAEQGQAASVANQPAEARRAYAEALAILDRRGDATSLARGVLESSIAAWHMDQAIDGGLEHARRAVTILRRHPPSPSLVRALERFAYLASDKGELEASIAAVREGLAVAATLGEPGRELIGTLHQYLSGLQLENHEWRDAEDSVGLAFAEAIQRHGADSSRAIWAATATATLLYEHGLYRRAREFFETKGTAVEARIAGGDRTPSLAIALGYRGAAKAMTGSVNDGIADLQRALGTRETIDANPRVSGHLIPLLADAWTDRGDYARAAETLDATRAGVVNRASADPYSMRRHDFARLRLAQAQGDREAIELLVAALGLEQPGDYYGRRVPMSSEHPDSRARRLVALSEARLAAGDPASALAHAEVALAIIEKSVNAPYQVERKRRASVVAGKSLVALERPLEAIEHLRRSVSLANDPLDIRNSLRNADALAALATALADVGSRDEARRIAAEVAAIHDAHGPVAPHFRIPFERLQERFRSEAATPVRYR